MPALLFGSIGTLADTSELQRQAFNDAFAAHGLPWTWERDEYRELLTKSGGAQRIAEYAQAQGRDDVDAVAVHQTKGNRFRELVAEHRPALRDGVLETLKAAKERGHQVGLVTTTAPANVDAILQALSPDITATDFDVIVDTEQVEQPKPDPAAYHLALEKLGAQPGDAVAVEDNVGGLQAARAADVRCVGFPGSNNTTHDFGAASATVDRLDPDTVLAA